jgi:hypothetical protein
MFDLFSAVNYKDQALYNRVKSEANKKFAKNSYVKNLWILKEYKKRGGKVGFEGKKPQNKAIQKQVKGSEIIIHVNYAEAAEHAGKKVNLNKPFRTPKGPKKFAVYTKNGSGKVVIVRFGDPNLSIKRDDPARRKNFRARMRCDNPGPKWKARYWACQTWRADKSVKDITGEEIIDWDNLPTQEDLFGNSLPHFDIEEIEENCSC